MFKRLLWDIHESFSLKLCIVLVRIVMVHMPEAVCEYNTMYVLMSACDNTIKLIT
jgi:hypothetical protein